LWGGGVLLAAATFLRPNLIVAAALLLAFLAVFHLRRSDRGAVALLGVGFLPVLWMPFHNWYFGGKWILLTAAGDINLLMPPARYFEAIVNLLSGHFQADAVSAAITHLGRWLNWQRAATILSSALVLSFLWLSKSRFSLADARRVLHAAVFCVEFMALALVVGGLHSVLWFYHPNGRYSDLAWQLTIVLLVVLLFRMRDSSREWVRVGEKQHEAIPRGG